MSGDGPEIIWRRCAECDVEYPKYRHKHGRYCGCCRSFRCCRYCGCCLLCQRMANGFLWKWSSRQDAARSVNFRGWGRFHCQALFPSFLLAFRCNSIFWGGRMFAFAVLAVNSYFPGWYSGSCGCGFYCQWASSKVLFHGGWRGFVTD